MVCYTRLHFLLTTTIEMVDQLIAVYTFVGLATGDVVESMGITAGLVIGVWIFIGILIGAGHAASQGPYMSPVPVGFFSTNRRQILIAHL